MDHTNNDVSMWLEVLAKQTSENISLFAMEYNRLNKLAPVVVVRVIKTPQGEPRLFFINRLDSIKLLKDLYAFHSKSEIEEEFKTMYLES